VFNSRANSKTTKGGTEKLDTDIDANESYVTEVNTMTTSLNTNNIASNFSETIKKYNFDECCKNRINVDNIVMESMVNVRRKLFFYKRR